MRKADRTCTFLDVLAKLKEEDPSLWTKKVYQRVKRWSFAPDTKNKNRGYAVDPELEENILARHADSDVPDLEKTLRNMASHFTEDEKTPVSREYVRSIYKKADLYPARETKELDLRQHHHRRLRLQFAKKHRRMTEKDWKSWVYR